MWEDFCFYMKLAKPIVANLGRRVSNEMADLGVSFKKKVSKAVFENSRNRNSRLEIIIGISKKILKKQFFL